MLQVTVELLPYGDPDAARRTRRLKTCGTMHLKRTAYAACGQSPRPL